MLIASEADLIATMKAARERLKLSHLATDQKAGMQEGYTGKLENPDAPWGRRTVGTMFWLWLGALDLVLIAVPRSAVAPGASLARQTGPKRVNAAQVLSVSQAVDLCPFGRQTLFRKMKSGDLPFRYIGGRRVIALSDLERLLAGHHVAKVEKTVKTAQRKGVKTAKRAV